MKYSRVVLLIALVMVGVAWPAADPVAQAGAPASASPFAGTYSGSVPGGWWFDSIRISDQGAVSGSYAYRSLDDHGRLYWNRGNLSGTVSDAGAMSASGTVSWTGFWFWYSHVPPGSSDFAFNATVSLDASGNLAGTTTDGTSFTWTRR